MTPQMRFSETGRIPTKLITLLGCLLAIAVLFSAVGRASANPAPASHPELLHQRAPAPGQVAPEQDASLSEIAVAANGDRVTLVPAFDPDTTLYTATVEAESAYVTATAAGTGAVIDRTSVGEDTTDLASPGKKVHMSPDVAEGTATVVSLRVRAADQVTTETYYVILSRPAGPSVPDITISANPSEYVAGSGPLIFTLSREGDTAERLVVPLVLVEEREWLLRIGGGTPISVSFMAGESEAELTIPATEFSSSETQSGNLAATLAPVTGYDTSGAALVRIISQEEPAVTVTLDSPTYTVAEDAGTLDVELVARARPDITSVDAFSVAISADAQTAVSDPASPDYRPVSEHPRFTSSDFQMENGALVGRKTISITILEDDVIEGEEYFHLHLGRTPGLSQEIVLLDPEGDACSVTCPNPYLVTIAERNLTADEDQPGISEPACESNGVFIFWQAANSFDDSPPPYGWRVERRHRSGSEWVTARFDFLGAESDALQTYSDEYWDWTDRTRRPGVDYTYRVHALDNNGELLEGRMWSRRAPAFCIEREHDAARDQPGISIPRCESNGVFIFWHAGIEFNGDPPPHGWRVERRHWSNEEWITARFDFLGAEAHALQTYSDEYWDWTDTTRQFGVDYTYRVHALDDDGELLEGRNWSRRAPVRCQ